MDLLEQVKKICKNHGLKYFADSGTLIGAIRHKGYIPWDDDIDLVMMRNDYNKFMEYAKSELEFPYFLQTVYTDKDIMRAHAQLRNSKTTGYMPYEKIDLIIKGFLLIYFP
ncbi:MAG: LicD family protein [Ruminococcus sp.]